LYTYLSIILLLLINNLSDLVSQHTFHLHLLLLTETVLDSECMCYLSGVIPGIEL
jgi:hypothetical protein